MAAYAVILAGGSGTRFWPASRASFPKQFLHLGKDPGESLIAGTLRRLSPLIPPERVYVATGQSLVAPTVRELPGVPREQVLAEPVARNTAPCIGWAVSVIQRRDPNAVVAVLPADHAIRDEEAFRTAVSRAIEAAAEGMVVTIGIVPTRPETGFGYIETADPLSGGLLRIARFIEKPDRDGAEAFVSHGKLLWNAGMFFFQARTMRTAIAEHLPALDEGLRRIEAASAKGADAVGEVFPGLPSISIDHGVMERASLGGSPPLAVVPGDFGWSDVGSWESAWELSPRDSHGNALPEGSVAVDAHGNLVRDLTTGAGKRVSALVGVSDLVLVETDDAVLVIPRARAQEVRAVVEELKAKGDRRL